MEDAGKTEMDQPVKVPTEEPQKTPLEASEEAPRQEPEKSEESPEAPRRPRPEPRQAGKGFGSSFRKPSNKASKPPPQKKKLKSRSSQGKGKPGPQSKGQKRQGSLLYKWIVVAALVIWFLYIIVTTIIRYNNGTLV